MISFVRRNGRIIIIAVGLFLASYSFAAAGYVNDILVYKHYSRGVTGNATNVYDYKGRDAKFHINNVFSIYNSNGVNGVLKKVQVKATVYDGYPFYTNLFLWDNYKRTWGWRTTAIYGEFLGRTYTYYPEKTFNDSNGNTYMYNSIVTGPWDEAGTEVRQYTHIDLR